MAAPLRLQRGSKYPLVRCGLGEGDGMVDMLVDTGADLSILSRSSVSELDGIPAELRGERVEALSLHGARHPGELVALDLCPGGWATPEKTPVILFPYRTGAPSGADGVMGMAFLNRVGAVIDLGRLRMLSAGGLEEKIPENDSGWVTLTLIDEKGSSGTGRRADGFKYVDCLTADTDRSLTWLLDTGSSKTLLSASSAEAVGVRTWRGNDAALVDGNGRRVSMRYGALNHSRWGGIEVGRLPIAVLPMPALDRYEPASGASVDGILGMDFLARFDAVIDLSRGQLRLRVAP